MNNGRFQKGNVPWNKGIPVRLNPSGEFQKGQVPWNRNLRSAVKNIAVHKAGWKTYRGWLCQQCHHVFWKSKKQTYCSQACMGAATTEKSTRVFVCQKCGVSKIVLKCYRPKYYCSNECRAKDLNKEKHPSWKGGFKRDRDQRKSYDMEQWRKKIYEKDDFTCQICFHRGGILEAHHNIFPYSVFPAFRINLFNGMTVHKECHAQLFQTTTRKKLITFKPAS